MKGLDAHINESLDILIENELLLGSELKTMLKGFIEEKTAVGFPLVNCVFGIMKHFQKA